MPSREEKQDIIREGMEKLMMKEMRYFRIGSSTEQFAKDVVEVIRRYLHSQGVVIKVDRELPEVYHKLNPIARADEQQDMLKVGYTAWKSLIED